ncbi:transposase [Micromonospora olivasterospora]|uniref:Transposase n=1 Tax=Micromonospora olivasterospora TaxID=1880 RepID=A0A562I895_MICOL|nr:transposase [Micromonospora olivasterospora]
MLSKFRARLVEHGLEEQVFIRMLAVLADKGLVSAGGKQRTDSTHVISAVRDLNRLELAGESVPQPIWEERTCRLDRSCLSCGGTSEQ